MVTHKTTHSNSSTDSSSRSMGSNSTGSNNTDNSSMVGSSNMANRAQRLLSILEDNRVQHNRELQAQCPSNLISSRASSRMVSNQVLLATLSPNSSHSKAAQVTQATMASSRNHSSNSHQHSSSRGMGSNKGLGRASRMASSNNLPPNSNITSSSSPGGTDNKPNLPSKLVMEPNRVLLGMANRARTPKEGTLIIPSQPVSLHHLSSRRPSSSNNMERMGAMGASNSSSSSNHHSSSSSRPLNRRPTTNSQVGTTKLRSKVMDSSKVSTSLAKPPSRLSNRCNSRRGKVMGRAQVRGMVVGAVEQIGMGLAPDRVAGVTRGNPWSVTLGARVGEAVEAAAGAEAVPKTVLATKGPDGVAGQILVHRGKPRLGKSADLIVVLGPLLVHRLVQLCQILNSVLTP
mmetsp:Transcript_15101/g.18937  ORF Transcript_15101/g.18937 Transcript_15101/m.18937 type:complete len:402 (+) Transcript_15101:170-1375(+)